MIVLRQIAGLALVALLTWAGWFAWGHYGQFANIAGWTGIRSLAGLQDWLITLRLPVLAVGGALILTLVSTILKRLGLGA
ncbi:hypothetical protein [Chachezhania sediminis]|uniref:hypothetical protein n=1 Tax=Chachezhania sediminis TaxID=2599291 RepID=UPI00131AACA0|nr:hypothetical protein [Chachezhania sediminis]